MKKNPIEQFQKEVLERIKSYPNNKPLQESGKKFLKEIVKAKYVYNFSWLGIPVIQIPQDLQALQEIIWEVKPDLIIETGIAHGGSLVFMASMLTILEACGKIKKGHVVGIDINIRPHNKKVILSHPLNKKISMFEGSSIDKKIVEKVIKLTKNKEKVLVCLDSDHTHDHVLAELKVYTPMVSVGSYCIVEDTGIEDLPISPSTRPWGKGNNPKTAVWEFLKDNRQFKIDRIIESKLILLGSPNGYLKRIK